ncbi:uncharacterized protein LOC113766476 [Coffea eugenioides]|uniref:uncharacterized protein LOC113766476 n=1 Tax=Coffea eugenioides TaxID=49369 RepID=UPI000F60603E|nr:uncharacterized protein LOC113766476 [Coffea eugenioides]
MPRSSRTCELIFIPEVEKTARQTRKETRQFREEQFNTVSQRLDPDVESTNLSCENLNDPSQEDIPMANARTLRELAAPELPQQPLCITFPTFAENTSFELKSGLIHLLPTFHGLSGEEPYKHIQEFDAVCSSMKPPGITEEQIKLRALPFSLKDAAKDWLYYLPAGSITTWAQFKKKFLKKFFPASRAAILRKEMCGIKQYPGESLYDYWEKFNKLYARCPQHQISEQLLIQYFYEGLQSSDRSIIDAAKNSQQFGFRESNPTRRVNEVETSSIQQQLSELTSFFRQLAVGNVHQAKVCGIYTNLGHPTDSCPMLQDEGAEQMNMVGGVPAPRKSYDPYSNTYNQGWRDHPNFSYGNRPQNSLSNRPPGFQQPWQPKPQPSSSNSGSSLEDIVKSLATIITQFQQETRAGMKNLEIQISHMATAINRLESQVFGKLQSQPEANLRNVSAMTLRSGKEVEGFKLVNSKSKSDEEIEEEGRIRENPKVKFTLSTPIKSNLPPFPCKLEKTKKQNKEKEILEVFRKVAINISLLNAIKQVPKYAQFLKNLCINKKKLRGDEQIVVGKNVSVILQRKLPPKCGDPVSVPSFPLFLLVHRAQHVVVACSSYHAPPARDSQYRALQDSIYDLGDQVEGLGARLAAMQVFARIQAKNQAAFFAHIGFTPPHPSQP